MALNSKQFSAIMDTSPLPVSQERPIKRLTDHRSDLGGFVIMDTLNKLNREAVSHSMSGIYPFEQERKTPLLDWALTGVGVTRR